MKRREYLYGCAIIFIFVLVILCYTVAPTLSFWDCGEFVACGYSLGVPHPPCSPIHVIILKIFSLIPFGKEIGLRTNMASVIPGAASAALIWFMIIRVIEGAGKINNKLEKIIAWASASCGAIIGAFSYTCWWTSVETETDGKSTFILLLLLYIMLKWDENIKTKENKKYLLLLIYLITLAAGIHLLPLLAVPGSALFIFIRNRQENKDTTILPYLALVLPFFMLSLAPPVWLWLIATIVVILFILIYPKSKDYKFLATAGLLGILGFTTYIYLPIRARQYPLINETEPTTMKRMWEAFTRTQYGPTYAATFFKRNTSIETGYSFFRGIYEQIRFFTNYLIWQWMPYPREERWEKRELSISTKLISVIINTMFVLLGLYGMYTHWKKEKNTFALIFTAFMFTSILLTIYANFKFSPTDPNPLHNPREVRERHYFFAPAFYLYGLYIGIGVWGILYKIKNIFAIPIVGIGIIPIFGNFWSHVNRRGAWAPDDYAYNMLMTLDDNSTVFTNGDNDTFPLWFAQAVKNIKPSVKVANLSLLNTDWHIRQLKRMGAPISFTDYEINNLMPYPVVKDGKLDKSKILLVKDFGVRDIIATNGGYKFEKNILMPIKRENLPSEYRKRFPKELDVIPPQHYTRLIPQKYWFRMPEEYLLPPKDFADLVCKDYKPKYPVYFAVTVSQDNLEGFQPYLQMEAMAYRVVGSGAIPFHLEKTDSLLNKVYKYRNLFNPKVYIDENTKRLLTNYAAAYFYLGLAYERRGEIDKAIDAMEMGRKFKTEETLPFDYQLSRLYALKGESEKAQKYIERFAKESKKAAGWYLLGKQQLAQKNEIEAEKSFKKAMELEPKEPMGYAGLIELYYLQNNMDKIDTIFSKYKEDPELAGKVLSIFHYERQKEIEKLLLEKWLKLYPYDTVAKGLLKELQ